MTSRAKYTPIRIEADIEKNREQSNWSKVIELAEQLKETQNDTSAMRKFLIKLLNIIHYLSML